MPTSTNKEPLSTATAREVWKSSFLFVFFLNYFSTTADILTMILAISAKRIWVLKIKVMISPKKEPPEWLFTKKLAFQAVGLWSVTTTLVNSATFVQRQLNSSLLQNQSPMVCCQILIMSPKKNKLYFWTLMISRK